MAQGEALAVSVSLTQDAGYRRDSSQMRTYILYGALALTGCTSPEAAFPSLASLPTPTPSATTPEQRDADLKALQAEGDTTREAGRLVRAGVNQGSDLPK
ncbi:hypothetical protein sos41_25490 [Alphaproteobacteria bacterium SO-S41]|nr:hypothetical protein sos41_25490 [Alphaproteobacteria bacterium SO-S41]